MSFCFEANNWDVRVLQYIWARKEDSNTKYQPQRGKPNDEKSSFAVTRKRKIAINL